MKCKTRLCKRWNWRPENQSWWGRHRRWADNQMEDSPLMDWSIVNCVDGECCGVFIWEWVTLTMTNGWLCILYILTASVQWFSVSRLSYPAHPPFHGTDYLRSSYCKIPGFISYQLAWTVKMVGYRVRRWGCRERSEWKERRMIAKRWCRGWANRQNVPLTNKQFKKVVRVRKRWLSVYQWMEASSSFYDHSLFVCFFPLAYFRRVFVFTTPHVSSYPLYWICCPCPFLTF